MRRVRDLTILLAVVVTLPMANACGAARSGQAAGDVDYAGPIPVEVRNDNFADMAVYAVSDGISTRIGTVTGNTKGILKLDPSFAYRNVSLVATPIGGFGRASSGNLSLSRNSVVEFHITPSLNQSSAIIK